MNEKNEICACARGEYDPGDTIICRCEEITRREIEEAIDRGVADFRELRRLTRAGMGLCQGHTCGRLAREIFAEKTGTPIDKVASAVVRVPVKPIPLEAVGSGISMPEFDDPKSKSGREAPAYADEIYEEAFGGDGPVIL